MLHGARNPSSLTVIRARLLGNGRVVRLDPGTTKNKDGQAFPFTLALETLLLAKKAEYEDRKQKGKILALVFHRNGKRIKDLRSAWATACENAGVPGRLIHDFRRTSVRNLDRASIALGG